MKKILTAIMVLSMTVGMLAACGNTDDTASVEATLPQTDTADVTSTEVEGNVTEEETTTTTSDTSAATTEDVTETDAEETEAPVGTTTEGEATITTENVVTTTPENATSPEPTTSTTVNKTSTSAKNTTTQKATTTTAKQTTTAKKTTTTKKATTTTAKKTTTTKKATTTTAKKTTTTAKATTTAPKTTTKAKTTTTSADVVSDKYVQEVFKLTNAEREKHGLKPYVLDPIITKAAMIRAKEVYQNFSHTRPDGRGYTSAIIDAGGTWELVGLCGENIHVGSATPKDAVQHWKDSPAHYGNMLGDYTRIGIGYYNGAWVQIFCLSDYDL